MIGMQRSEIGPRAPRPAVPWADEVRRARHPEPISADEFSTWRTAAVERLAELLAVDTAQGDGRLIIEGDDELQLVTLVTDDGDVPCWLLTPPADRRRDVAVVAVAGHGDGIDDLVAPTGTDDFHGGLAHKLVGAGFTVLCPEMISFGRRRTPMPASAPPAGSSCQVDGMRGLLTGRPVLGRRVADTMAAVRSLRTLDAVDPTKIAVVGGSGGGAVALLTAALDDQIPAAVVATFLSSFVDSFCGVPHCICNAVPDLLTWFEMADVGAMIAPRRLIIEAGRQDPIFPIAATEATYAELVDVWRGLDAIPPDLVITDAAHQFRADDAIALLRHHLITLP
jgi:pimeloyl-ACP methyl ester carboxylesterase